MKKFCVLIALILTAALLAACGGGNSASKAPVAASTAADPVVSSAAPASAKPSAIKATVVNSSGYIFHELYISPTAVNEWGEDHLGSTSLLKKGGSFEINVQAYDFNTYDIRIVDEDEDIYLFTRVPISAGSTIDITWESELIAVVSGGSGESVSVTGKMESGSSGDDYTSNWQEMNFFNDTSFTFLQIYVFDTNITNESEIGYNHIANQNLRANQACVIGVDYYQGYGIYMIDNDGDKWYFENVLLEEGAFVTIDFDDGPELYIDYADGANAYYSGSLL